VTDSAQFAVAKLRLRYVMYGREDSAWPWRPLYGTCADMKGLVALEFHRAGYLRTIRNGANNLFSDRLKKKMHIPYLRQVMGCMICPPLFPQTNTDEKSSSKSVIHLMRNRILGMSAVV
jgi:hypothetical protein